MGAGLMHPWQSLPTEMYSLYHILNKIPDSNSERFFMKSNFLHFFLSLKRTFITSLHHDHLALLPLSELNWQSRSQCQHGHTGDVWRISQAFWSQNIEVLVWEQEQKLGKQQALRQHEKETLLTPVLGDGKYIWTHISWLHTSQVCLS
jgi:hypothetical protein